MSIHAAAPAAAPAVESAGEPHAAPHQPHAETAATAGTAATTAAGSDVAGAGLWGGGRVSLQTLNPKPSRTLSRNRLLLNPKPHDAMRGVSMQLCGSLLPLSRPRYPQQQQQQQQH